MTGKNNSKEPIKCKKNPLSPANIYLSNGQCMRSLLHSILLLYTW